MASYAKRALETDSDSHESSGVEPTSKRSCLKLSPTSNQPCEGVSLSGLQAASEPSSASGEPSPSSSEFSPSSNEPVASEEEAYSHLAYSDKLIVDLTGDSDDDEQDYSCPPSQTVNIESRSELINSQLLRHLGMKRFLVDHDYILCPYCIVTDQGKRVKPSETRVSKIIKRYIDQGNKGYMEIVEVLKEMDKIFDVDTSEYKTVHLLVDQITAIRTESKDTSFEEFMAVLRCTLQLLTDGNNNENIFRDVFSYFLRIWTTRMKSTFVFAKPSLQSITVSFPNWKKSTTIRGKPDIVITTEQNNYLKTLAVVECKKYRELKFMFETTEVKDDDDLQKALPRSLFCSTAKKLKKSEESEKREVIMERMYKDLDASICRGLKHSEKTYFDQFLGQLVGEVLACFNTSNVMPAILPFEIAREKCMRYAIGLLGFKIIFVTVGINNSCLENPPHIKIGERTGMGLDVFITRPFDMMKASDREKIRDILFVMMRSHWKPVK